jgi:ferric-dicitrate binding protein FerR (iron transport regulator)
MSERKTPSPEVQALLVKAADGELDDRERQELKRLAQENPSVGAEVDELRAASRALSGFGLRDPNPDDWAHFERSLLPRGERMLGWLLMLGGLAVLVGLALFGLFTDAEVPLVAKIGGGALIGGLAVLAIHVGRRALRERRRDPYKDIVR